MQALELILVLMLPWIFPLLPFSLLFDEEEEEEEEDDDDDDDPDFSS